MINLEKIPQAEQDQLTSIIQKNSERSEFDKFYLFTEKPVEKAKLYIWGYRFLLGMCNIVDRSLVLFTVLRDEVDLNKELYIRVSKLLHEIETTNFNKSRNLKKLQNIMLTDERVAGMIDVFSILLERQNVMSMSRLKGIILEGQSGKEFKKIMGTSSAELVTTSTEENFTDDPEEEKEEDLEKDEDFDFNPEPITKEELKEDEAKDNPEE